MKEEGEVVAEKEEEVEVEEYFDCLSFFLHFFID